MPTYLTLARYTAEGSKGFLKEKASGREAALRKTVEGVGGKLHALYWGTGEKNIVILWEFPDAGTAAALEAVINSYGVVASSESFELLTSAEMDQALGKVMAYRPPGA